MNHLRRHFVFAVLCLSLFSVKPFAATAAKPALAPLTTSSPVARRLYLHGLDRYANNLQQNKALDAWRAAVRLDPKFAMAWIQIATVSRNPRETHAARVHAKSSAVRTSRPEQLFIKWSVDVQEDNYIDGISAMNDLLSLVPGDKWMLYLTGTWLMNEGANDRARALFEKTLVLDPNFPATLNNLGYLYARKRDFPKAIELLSRYTKLIPGEPNGEDSQAEILRQSGNFEGALQHYHAALKIDPKFFYSQYGLADTYSLMGAQSRARTEYEKAIAMAGTEADRLDYLLQSAASYVREGNYAEADKKFAAVALRAHRAEHDLHEARAHRFMSLYQSDGAAALHHLDEAEDSLHHSTMISGYERQLEQAAILRARIFLIARNYNLPLAEDALSKLGALSDSTRNQSIEREYQAATGALFMARRDAAEAIPHLKEDIDNPFSMELLARAYKATGDERALEEMENRLLNTNIATMEQALVVLPARQAAHAR